MNCNTVILAGGFGERLWPVSSKDFPKQFMALEGGLSFLQQSLERAFLLGSESILIVCRTDILQTVAKQCSDYANTLDEDSKNMLSEKLTVVAEPCQKHTAPPLAFACRYFQATQKDEKAALVLTGDHIIEPFKAFKNDVQKAIIQAQKEDFVCFAIPPTHASTGFGYMEVEKTSVDGIFRICHFKEKPDAHTATQYLQSGNYRWNSGMFCVLPSVFMEELNRYTKEVASAFPECDTPDFFTVSIQNGIRCATAGNYMIHAYDKTAAISIDHAVAEKTAKSCAVQSTFSWQDIGTWDSFSEQFTGDDNKNSGTHNTVALDSTNCFVYSDVPVLLCGVEDLIVSIKNGNVLILKKGCGETIKDGIKKLQELS